jgi:hypothetical protein
VSDAVVCTVFFYLFFIFTLYLLDLFTSFISQTGRMIEKTFKMALIAAAVAIMGYGGVTDAAPSRDAPGRAGPSREYLVKAAFLYNFAKFTVWPAKTFADPSTPLRLCLLGKDPFQGALDSLAGKTVRKRKLEIHRLAKTSGLGKCHLLFVSASENKRLATILKVLRGMPVLAVGDMPNFAHSGGIINLKTVRNKVRFEINITAAKRAHLKFSSKLLRLAEIVRGRQGQGRDR